MSYEIDAQGRELDVLLDEFRDTLRRVNNFNADDRNQKIKYCEQLEQQIRTVRQAYVLELKSLEDPQVRESYHAQLKARSRQLRSLAVELDQKRNEIDKEQLAADAEELDDAQCNTELITVAQVAAQGDKVQDKTQQSVNRMKALVADAERIGIDTAGKMDEQIAQMGGIAETLDDVQFNTARAKNTAASIAKNAATDRCIQGLCGSIFICIIIVIVLMATKN